MANQFHDAEGKFTSRAGMLQSVHELAAAGKVSEYLTLKAEFDEADKNTRIIVPGESEFGLPPVPVANVEKKLMGEGGHDADSIFCDKTFEITQGAVELSSITEDDSRDGFLQLTIDCDSKYTNSKYVRAEDGSHQIHLSARFDENGWLETMGVNETHGQNEKTIVDLGLPKDQDWDVKVSGGRYEHEVIAKRKPPVLDDSVFTDFNWRGAESYVELLDRADFKHTPEASVYIENNLHENSADGYRSGLDIGTRGGLSPNIDFEYEAEDALKAIGTDYDAFPVDPRVKKVLADRIKMVWDNGFSDGYNKAS